MAGDIKNAYGSSGQTITITLASLANAGMRQSSVVSNTTDKYADVLVSVQAKSGASGVSTSGYVDVYAYGTSDGGAKYSGGASGTDGAFSGNTALLVRLGRLPTTANATIYPGGPWSVAMAFGGSLPDHWGIVVDNESGASLDSTSGNFVVTYQGVYGAYT